MSSFHPARDGGSRADWSRINQWLLWVGLAVAVAWLLIGHGEHLLRLAPLLLVLACPLMHLFGHRHGRHGGLSRHGPDQPNDEGERPTQPDPRGSGHLH